MAKTLTDKGFTYDVRGTIHLMLQVSGVTFHEFYTDPLAGIETFRPEHFRTVENMYRVRVNPVDITTPAISYGHLCSLGFDLVFPEGMGEVNYVRREESLSRWIELLEQDAILSDAGLFYLEYRDKLRQAYPGREIPWCMGYEGPLTTAYELRDMDIFFDVYDRPEQTKMLLDAVCDHTTRYIRIHRNINGKSFYAPEAGLCDDVAAMFPPGLWDEFVLPYWDNYYRPLTGGKRHLHCEDLTRDHLPYLKKADIHFFDPSVSRKLTPGMIRDNTPVPFSWRLADFHYRDLTTEDVQDWVFQSVADGANRVFTYVTQILTDPESIQKVETFAETAALARDMIDAGVSRQEIGNMVSPGGKKRFFDHWPLPRIEHEKS